MDFYHSAAGIGPEPLIMGCFLCPEHNLCEIHASFAESGVAELEKVNYNNISCAYFLIFDYGGVTYEHCKL